MAIGNLILLLLLAFLVPRSVAFHGTQCKSATYKTPLVDITTSDHRLLFKSLIALQRPIKRSTPISVSVLQAFRSPPSIPKSNIGSDSDLDVVSPVLALIVQNSGLILMMRYTMLSAGGGGKYIVSTAVFMCEILKFLISTLVVFFVNAKGSLFTFNNVVWKEGTKAKVADTIAIAFPACLYIIQNNLQYLAVANLSPAIFQVLYQFKIVTAAIFSVLILRKRLFQHQWASIILLMVGLASVQLSQQIPGVGFALSTCNPIGIAAVALASLTSGLAGVLVEGLLKGGSKMSPLWLRNMQMSFVGSIFSALSLLKDKSLIQSMGLLSGYNKFVWSAIGLQSAGGLIVALVVKRSDNLVKGFATSMSILISCIFSSLLFKDVTLSKRFILGAITVIVSTFWYGWDPNRSTINKHSNNKSYGISKKYW